MRRTIAVLTAVITVGLWFVPRFAAAQEESKEGSSAQPAKVKPVRPYRLDFSFNEIADGKTVNTRHYSMNLTAGGGDEIKIGARVPVATGSGPNGTSLGQYQYMDIGTQIWAQLRDQGDDLVLLVRGEVSNLDMDAGDHASALPPVVRQIKINGDTLLVVGKPIVIGSADDPNSKRQFQLEVMVTKLK
jgi:hypothetical protein